VQALVSDLIALLVCLLFFAGSKRLIFEVDYCGTNSINKTKHGRQYLPLISPFNTMSMLDTQRDGTQYNNKNTTLCINDKEEEISSYITLES
jgi:hypothetical protein